MSFTPSFSRYTPAPASTYKTLLKSKTATMPPGDRIPFQMSLEPVFYKNIVSRIKIHAKVAIETYAPASILRDETRRKHFIFAGGMVCDVYHGQPFNDFDVYVTDPVVFQVLSNEFTTIQNVNGLSHQSKYFGQKFDFRNGGKDFDVMRFDNHNTPQDVLNTFDFMHCAIGVQYHPDIGKMQVFASKLALHALYHKLLIINEDRSSVWNQELSQDRVDKYTTLKGYKLAGHSKDFYTV